MSFVKCFGRAGMLTSAATLAIMSHAEADVTISADATSNMACSGGICTPTAKDAVLNVDELEILLSIGAVEIADEFRGRGAASIDIDAPLSLSTPHVLALYDKITLVNQPISVSGAGGMNISSALAFRIGPHGNITYTQTGSTFVLNGVVFTLESTLPGLASGIAANPAGAFALAQSYDAGQDGTYSASPITTNFNGMLLGLGHVISNISVNNTDSCCVGGLFQSLSGNAVVEGLKLSRVGVVSNSGAAGLAYESFGTVRYVSVTGKISTDGSDAGGLIGDNYGTVSKSYADVTVSGGATVNASDIGGLIGANFGGALSSFATGAVSAGDGSADLGGLIGEAKPESYLLNCYATGNVSGGSGPNLGGLIGENDDNASVEISYSAGSVAGSGTGSVGGSIGINNSNSSYSVYWDTSTSGTEVGVGLGNDAGITGLTTAQLQSGLPSGFDPKVWAEKAKLNQGFPYLKSNKPPK